MNVDTLIHARWIIPVEPENTVFEDYALAIKNDKIVALLNSDDARNKISAKEEFVLENQALLPGFVNAHTHAAMSLFRGLANDLPLMNWLNNYIWPAEKKWIDSEFVKDGSKLAIAEMLRGGTTCFNDMYFFSDSTAEVCVNAGMRAVIGLIVIDLPTSWASNSDEYLAKGESTHDSFKHNPLINTAFAPHAPYTVSNDSLERIAVLAEELDIPIHMHIHETDDEIKQSLKQYGKRPLKRLSELGLLNSRLIAVHMTQLEQYEIEELKKTKVNIAHCPESNLKLASGFCPVGKLHKSNINVCIGTDGTAGGVEEGSITFDICKEIIDDFVLVSEKEIVSGIRKAINDHHQLIEGSAGAAIAAFIKRKNRLIGKRVVIIICGGNIHSNTLHKVLS